VFCDSLYGFGSVLLGFCEKVTIEADKLGLYLSVLPDYVSLGSSSRCVILLTCLAMHHCPVEEFGVPLPFFQPLHSGFLLP
jgi:hypothetical protein